ncbi:Septum formation protein Maf [Methanosarcina siciliae C2J]|uniref:dTTP/UTP pyrophosphatase n=3 Tax=Methanosarcina siciliae TaxID=38027 RepID=A0A0E3LA33_9EURY|nr:Maf family nucleotide pyrophosphatase [Methanosarcina siciliae]AKB27381.1 Septum formation protein Maf [Methanosarcina siciliae T4/M]AKB31321.1 Septum formation protein Maf [Methanosarcina siciliae HI350]AKB35277.1 Septum formation protein Maf [Methanosarcina siciliae C2J]
MRRIILASSSPRRKELLKQLIGDNFVVYPSSYDEPSQPGLDPEELLLKHSVEKARDVVKHFDSGIVISADTSVLYDGEVLGKPGTPENAEKMLKKLSGKKFRVVTGLTVLDLDSRKEISEFESTNVWLAELSKEQISAYVRTGEPLDKAGAFAAQGKGAVLVEKVEGDFFNAVGLPLFRLEKILERLGVSVFDESFS